MGKQTERDLNWQITNLNVPVDEHAGTRPILYISPATKPVTLNDEQQAKLKQYVEQGGMIVFNADCGLAGESDQPVQQFSAEAGQGNLPAIRISRLA